VSLQVHRSGASLLEALQVGRRAYYATFARSRTDAAVLRRVEEVARERSHINIAEVPALREKAESLLRSFFDDAARADPQWRYAYSSRVLLAIPDYPDIAQLFLLRALRAISPQSTAHALVEDEWQARLATFEAEGAEPPAFTAAGRKGFLRAARSFARRVVAASPPGPCDVVLFTLGDNHASGAPDAYFGELAGTIARKCSAVTVYASPGKRLTFPVRADAVPLEAFLGWSDAPAAWVGSRRSTPANGALSPPDQALGAYLRAREHDMGEVAMQQVMARAFDRMLAHLRPKALVYPFENRSWEKHLLAAARRHDVARCIGYQHSSLTPRHLAFTDTAGLAGMTDLPDTILTCGEITAERIESGVPQARTRVTVGAALRARRLPLGPAQHWGLLAPISSSRAEAWEILRMLHALSGHADTPIIVRTHPTIPIDDLYAQFDWPPHVRLSRGRSLAQDFEEAALVAYSSSTVALEGMLYGRLPIYLEIGDVPSGDPIGGEHAFVFRASNVDELASVIERIRALPGDELQQLREGARAFAGRYLIEPTPSNVERMADLIAPC
jgi:hypothetical protein